MTVYHFNQLDEVNQLNALDKLGVLVAERESSFCQIKLYQVGNFYVEVYFHTHFNVVVNVNCFTNTDCLDPYLQNVNIEELLLA